MRVDLFDYPLPAELIAQEPASPRDAARLLVLERSTGRLVHATFRDLSHWLRPGDCLVANDTRVIPARLRGRRKNTDGQWEALFIAERGTLWEVMARTRGKPAPGERIVLDTDQVELELIERTPAGHWLVRPPAGAALALLESVGHVPLPPYIRAGVDQPADRNAYQTMFAREAGAVAAPTAGLHFTPGLLDQLRQQGVLLEQVTLHVGPGTFQPVRAANTQDHPMHAEWCHVPAEVAERLRAVRAGGGRTIAVGTTVARTLESACQAAGELQPFAGQTRLFIVPPYTFRGVDALITNFHLPKSTLLMLVAAFAGLEPMRAAYAEAVRQRYRFYSYGDAMLIV